MTHDQPEHRQARRRRYASQGVFQNGFCLNHLVLLLVWVFAVPALAGPARDSHWYYHIGGAKAVSEAANPVIASASLGGNLSLSNVFSCGNFDPTSALTNVLGNVKGQVMSAYGGLIAAATSAIGALPAFILQRASPGLYDLYQNAVLRGEAVVRMANASCEQMESEIRQGKNPYERFTSVSKMFDWKVQMGNKSYGGSGTDVVTALKNVETNSGSHGIPWLGGLFAGGTQPLPNGTAQAPVQVVSDTIKAGYNIELGRNVTDATSAPTGNNATPLGKTWATPADAQAYAVYVLGDVAFSTNKTAQRKATPGHGLLPKIETDKTTILASLKAIVEGSKAPSAAELANVSAPSTDLTREVIEAIRSLPTPQEKAVAMQKLAEEAATSHQLEKAMLLRRLLQSGRMEPNIYAAGVDEELDRAVSGITQAIDTVLYETRIRRELFSQTASVLLSVSKNRLATEAAVPPALSNDAKTIINGEVSTK
jgi:integrating conjugative element protein (TIGR03755 family)